MKSRYLLIFCILLAACAKDNKDEISGGNTGIGGGEQPIVLPSLPGDHAGHPSQGTKEQARGFYSNGKILHDSHLAWSGTGFTKILRPRNRRYGSKDLLYVITESAKSLKRLRPSRDRIQVGDMSKKGGGTADGHASHQNGLDADIAFLRLNQTEQDPNSTDGYSESFVKDGRVTANFDVSRNWELAKLFVNSGRVQRVFVNDVIKQEFCRYARLTGETESAREVLFRLRSYEGHMDHFHIRLTCPLKSPNCSPQEEPPEANDGCVS
ncbi:MAG: penicillin-insensitive murein endopeptidase [Bacteriovoracia bacterium]